MPKKNAIAQWPPENPGSLARQFSRLGWIGFWMQLVLVSMPLILILYVLFLSSPESAQRKGIDLSNYLSVIIHSPSPIFFKKLKKMRDK